MMMMMMMLRERKPPPSLLTSTKSDPGSNPGFTRICCRPDTAYVVMYFQPKVALFVGGPEPVEYNAALAEANPCTQLQVHPRDQPTNDISYIMRRSVCVYDQQRA